MSREQRLKHEDRKLWDELLLLSDRPRVEPDFAGMELRMAEYLIAETRAIMSDPRPRGRDYLDVILDQESWPPFRLSLPKTGRTSSRMTAEQELTRFRASAYFDEVALPPRDTAALRKAINAVTLT